MFNSEKFARDLEAALNTNELGLPREDIGLELFKLYGVEECRTINRSRLRAIITNPSKCRMTLSQLYPLTDYLGLNLEDYRVPKEFSWLESIVSRVVEELQTGRRIAKYNEIESIDGAEDYLSDVFGDSICFMSHPNGDYAGSDIKLLSGESLEHGDIEFMSDVYVNTKWKSVFGISQNHKITKNYSDDLVGLDGYLADMYRGEFDE